MVYAAACAWQHGESDLDRYRDAFDWAFYRNSDGHPFADGICKLADVHGRVGAVNFEMAYTSPFTEAGVALQNHLQNTGACREMLLFAARRMDFVLHKALLAGEMSDLYDAFVRDDDKGYAVNTALYDLIMPYASRLGSLRDMTKELKLFHRDLWRGENRPIHWDVAAIRYDRMLLEWEQQYDRIQLDLQQQGRDGSHLPREQVGFRFDRPQQ